MNNTNFTSHFLRDSVEIYLQVFVLILIVVTTLVGNVLVIAIIYLDYRLHKPGFYFLANLSAADLLVASVYIPFYIDASLGQRWGFSETWCKIHTVTISTSFNASLVTLSFVSVDRLLAITKPLRYQTLMTTRCSSVLIGLGWVHSIFWAMAPLIGWGEITKDPMTNTCRPNFGAKGSPSKIYALLLSFFSFALPTIIMIACYIRLFLVARHHVEIIKKNSIASTAQGANAQNNRVNETKALKTVLLVLGAFVLAWLPYTVVSTGKLITKNPWNIGPTAANAVLTITLISGSINPFIYSLRDKRFKSGFRKIICVFRATQADNDRDSYFSSASRRTHSMPKIKTAVEVTKF